MTIDYKKKINDLVDKKGGGFGPSLINLLLYNPVDKNLIKSSYKSMLDVTMKSIEFQYINLILPKMGQIVNAITSEKNENFPSCNKDMKNCFSSLHQDAVRRKLLRSWKGQFGLDDITAAGLNKPIKEKSAREDSKFYFRQNSRHLFSYRLKEEPKIIAKLDTKYSKLDKEEKKHFWPFIYEVAKDDSGVWEHYGDYEKKFGENLCEMLLGDILGIKIVDTFQDAAEKNMEKLVNKIGALDVSGFNHITQRFDDHRERLNARRPGGVYFTLTDKGLRNHPLEIQYTDLKSEIFNRFGTYAHKLYEQRGKKNHIDTN